MALVAWRGVKVGRNRKWTTYEHVSDLIVFSLAPRLRGLLRCLLSKRYGLERGCGGQKKKEAYLITSMSTRRLQLKT